MSFICYQDMLDSATRTVSSEDQLFPASNLYDQSNRGRVWRSAGYFKLTSANRTIIFQETVGVDLTATITTAAISSITQFAAQIKSALDSAGDSTYTVTHVSGKFVITSNGSGGGGIFRLMWSNVLSTAYDVLGFSNASDDTGSLTYTADYVRIHTEEFLTWDLGASSNPDAFIAIGKKGQALKLSQSATITLKGSLTNNFSSPAYTASLSYDELALVKLKADGDSGLHTSGLRYWQLHIVDRDNANGYIELSNVFLGDYYATERGKVQFPLSIGAQDFSDSVQFKSGAKAFSRSGRTENFSFNWFPLTTTEKEEFDTIKQYLGESKPFYLVMDPDLVFGSSLSYNTRYVRFSGGISLSLDRPGIWSSSWSVEECL